MVLRRGRVCVDLGWWWCVPEGSFDGVVAGAAAGERAGLGGQRRQHNPVQIVEVGHQSGTARATEDDPGLARFEAGDRFGVMALDDSDDASTKPA